MAYFASLKSAIFEKEERKQQYQAHIRGLNAYDRHRKFLKDYVEFYHKGRNTTDVLPLKTDQDTLREGYRFIRSEEDDMDHSWEQRLVKRYYDKLFKEYCIADVSHYKKGKIGLRWRTEKEVISGKGQFICGNKQCEEKDGLSSYEVNFSYYEAGENKQALVKLICCVGCAKKLIYKKQKEKEELEKKELVKQKEEELEMKELVKQKEKEELEKKELEKQKRKRERTHSHSDADDEYDRMKQKRRGKKASSSTNDQKMSDDENFDEFLEGMFP